ncbi:unnamed protein product [Parascedosporium putredinis]|uniref:Uncharacterized protein n=1 Tax=Parascedosporium putredinis TaxID=1442378 RepID=A0A9P1H457_9PEZI|nr:unnamed protein product [Parascedosporium putredinis]CAI7997936.1 unnamed protein product [Parascedosporium putredinis]
MAIPRTRAALALIAPSKRPLPCLLCQWNRSFSATSRRAIPDSKPSAPPEPDAAQTKPARPSIRAEHVPAGAAIEAPRSYGRRVDNFTPQPLPGPSVCLNLRCPAKIRDSTCAPSVSVAMTLSTTISTLFGASNYGLERDTTPQLWGRASVVAIFSSKWGEEQVDSLISAKANPELGQILDSDPVHGQIVRINVEDNSMKAWLISMFMGSLRKSLGQENWGRKVGYTYLVDPQCRIRWAASGTGLPDEQEGLVKGFRKLVGEAREIGEQMAAEQMAAEQIQPQGEEPPQNCKSPTDPARTRNIKCSQKRFV